MREIKGHVVEGDAANHQVLVQVTDEPGQGGANHRYLIAGFDTENNPSRDTFDKYSGRKWYEILFQNGPIKESGVNGITDQSLVALVIDRYRGFQRGQYACDDNAEALAHLEAFMECSARRTKARIARGVEGTHEK